jgi:hypothetical protein
MTLARRILAEKRPLIVPLVLALLANVAVYALVVRPLKIKSETAADRAASAAGVRQAAERDAAAARALVTGKTRADEELATFYGRVLPPDLAAARRMTYARLPALARKVNVKYDQRTSEAAPGDRNARLGRLRTHMTLEGDYNGLRQFIYELETTPEFIIIDDVTLSQSDPNKPLTLALELSTYYRQGANGA